MQYRNYIRFRRTRVFVGCVWGLINYNVFTSINEEFEQFYQGLLHNISHIPEEDLTLTKTNFCNTCKGTQRS